MPDLQSLIDSSVSGNKESHRVLLQALVDQLNLLNTATGNTTLNPTNGSQTQAAPAPNPGTISVSGANGNYSGSITNAKTAISSTFFNEVSYSPVKSFGQGVTTLEPTASTSFSVAGPGQTLFFRARWSFDKVHWSAYTNATVAVSSGFQSSAASENNTPLNQSNYGFVDSVDAGTFANVRVYGAAGPYNGFTSVKGEAESGLPSATIVNVTHGSAQIVSYDGEQYQLKSTLPGVFPDSWTPVGKVSVVGSGTPTLPVITPVIAGGHIVGGTFTPGSGLTQAPVLTIADTGGGTGATAIATISGGQMTGIQITNAGSGYTGATTIVATGGVFTGASGGGQSAGGNGGRLTDI